MRTDEVKTANKIGFILLIDDDRDDNEFHQQTIKDSGLSQKTETITEPRSAIAYLKNCLTEQPLGQFPPPDLVLLDLRMPPYTGFELLEEFKKLPDPYGRRKKIKFILLTGVVNPDNVQRVHVEYPDMVLACVVKPLEPGFLSNIAKKYFAK